MTDRKLRVRVLPKGRGGGVGQAAEAERSAHALTIRPPASSTPAGRFREISFRPVDDLEVHVRFHPRACADLLSHCAESNRHGREICGLILGTASAPSRDRQPQEYQLVATDVLPFKTSDASGAHVSAAADAWTQADREIESRFQGKERLGWYHTHPTQGIFFSAPDKDFHSVFTRPFQFALVVDARTQEVGLFYWQDRIAHRISNPIPLELRPTSPPSSQGALPEAEAPPKARSRHRFWILIVGLLGLAARLLTTGGANTAKLAPVAVLFLAALLLRLWNSETLLPARTEQPDGSRPREIRTEGALLSLTAVALVSMLLAVLLNVRPDMPGLPPPAVPPSPQASAPAPIQAHDQGPQGATAQPSPGVPAPIEVSVKAEPSPSRPLRILLKWTTNGAQQTATYIPRADGSYGVESGEDELLRHLLGTAHSPPSEVEIGQLQQAFGVKATGHWAKDSRKALLHSALRAETRTINFPPRKPWAIRFKAGE